ncbi:hypothetical protein KCU98_g234, partial [Aureobasidium melanogenum]
MDVPSRLTAAMIPSCVSPILSIGSTPIRRQWTFCRTFLATSLPNLLLALNKNLPSVDLLPEMNLDTSA